MGTFLEFCKNVVRGTFFNVGHVTHSVRTLQLVKMVTEMKKMNVMCRAHAAKRSNREIGPF